MSKRPFLLGIALVVVLGFGTTQRVCAQEVAVEKSAFLYQTHYFRFVLQTAKLDYGLEVLESIGDLANSPADRTVLICFGDCTELHTRLAQALQKHGGIRRFVETGGALFVVSDRSCPLTQAAFGVTITGNKVRQRNPQFQYRGLETCPIVNSGRPDNLFRTDGQLATNRPSDLGLIRTTAALSNGFLVDFPTGMYDERDPFAPDRRRIFSVGGSLDQGKLLVIADHSMFINCMMLQDDNDNVQLARNCIDWLVKKNGGRRDTILFLEDGEANTDLDIPVDFDLDIPLPEEAVLIDGINDVLRATEDDDYLNKMIRENIPHKWIMTVLAVLLGLGVFFFGFSRLGSRRYRTESSIPLLRPGVQELGAGSLPIVDRTESMYTAGNWLDAARAIAQQFFAVYLGQIPSHADVSRPPEVKPQGRSDRDSAINAELRTLWEIAYGEPKQQFSQMETARLMVRIRELKHDLTGRRLHLRR